VASPRPSPPSPPPPPPPPPSPFHSFACGETSAEARGEGKGEGSKEEGLDSSLSPVSLPQSDNLLAAAVDVRAGATRVQFVDEVTDTPQTLFYTKAEKRESGLPHDDDDGDVSADF